MAFIDTSKHVIDLFLEQAQATPDHLALEDETSAYTYAELNAAVDSMARRLRSCGISQESLVGVLLPHTADFIIACLASLRAGGAYLILEFAYPAGLLRDVIHDAGPHVLITYRSELGKIDFDIQIIILDDQEAKAEFPPNFRPECSLPTRYDQDSVSFVSYSSGTTGQPKGIANNDRPGVISYNQRFAVSDQSPGDRIACNTFFIWEMFRPLIRGATVFAVSDKISYDPIGLTELLASKRITETLMTPTLLSSILGQYPEIGRELPELRILWLTGEIVSIELARRALEALPNVRLLNSYSTSETWDTAVGDVRDMLDDTKTSTYCSVGAPLGENQVYILDESGKQLKPGMTGEIYVGGPALALGYFNLPKITAETFLPDPFISKPGARMYRSGDLGRMLPSGSVEIVGRTGSMIKLRGYSVIPAKIQTVIIKHLAVMDCAIVPYGEGLERQLAVYFVRDLGMATANRPFVDLDSSCFSPSSRYILSQHLAAYMIPTYWIEVTKLPANPISGKIDKKALPPPSFLLDIESRMCTKTLQNRDLGDSISIDTIAQFWALTLQIPRRVIKPEHTFFDLGGHSLSFANLSTRLASVLNVRVSVAKLVEVPTLQGHLMTVLSVRNQNTLHELADLSATLHNDSLLDKNIQPQNTKMCSTKAANVVFMTGVTGFLGATLLNDLLRNTSSTILCLVRPGNVTEEHRTAAAARFRIRQNLLEKGLWHDFFMDRIEVVSGDLSQANFGLSSHAFSQLAMRVQVIMHAGAEVNLTYPYSALRDSNVGGTKEVIRLASMGGSTIQHISTNSVLPPSSATTGGWPEDTNIDIDEVASKLPDGYGQTKWVAEQLMIEAGHRGFPVKILRLGNISGHSVTGAANDKDLLTALMTESIELGYAPEVDGWCAEMSPVDFVSKAIICLSNIETSQRIFHLGHPCPVSMKVVFQKLCKLGYETKSLRWDEWFQLWEEKRAKFGGDGLSLTGVLRSCMPTVKALTDNSILDNSKTEPHHSSVTRPDIDDVLLGTYSHHWFAKGWISKTPCSSILPTLGITCSRKSYSLRGHVAVVTGASSGIGAATAIALAREGVHLALAARRKEALEHIQKRAEGYGVQTLVQQTDVTDAEQVEALVSFAEAMLGPVDILITCAGVMYYTLMKNGRQHEWEQTIEVNCKGLLHCLSATVPKLLSRDRGHIVAISSDAGRKAFAGLGAYSGSKSFVEAILQSLRLETARTRLRVTSIQPGNVATDLLDLSTDAEAVEKYGKPSGAKVLDADDVANAVVYALKQPEHVAVNEVLLQPSGEPI